MKFIHYLFFILLSSCGIKTGLAESELLQCGEIIHIQPDYMSEITDLSAYMDSIKIIPLERTDEALIGEITKLITYKDRIYILDGLSFSLFVFDLEGKYLFKIHRVGQGPGEYQRLDFFDIDYEREQLVLTQWGNHCIMRYDMNGNFIKRLNVPYQLDGIYPFGDDYIISCNFRDNTKLMNQEYNVVYMDSLTNIHLAYFPYHSEWYKSNIRTFAAPMMGYCYYYDQIHSYYSPYSDTVYRINVDGLSPVYRINLLGEEFDSNRLPEKEYQEKIERSDYRYISDLYESKDLVYFSTWYAPQYERNEGFYSKKTGEVISGKVLCCGDVFVNYPVLDIYNGWVIANISPKSLLSGKDKLVKLLSEDKKPDFMDYMQAVDLESNPALLFYKLKEF